MKKYICLFVFAFLLSFYSLNVSAAGLGGDTVSGSIDDANKKADDSALDSEVEEQKYKDGQSFVDDINSIDPVDNNTFDESELGHFSIVLGDNNYLNCHQPMYKYDLSATCDNGFLFFLYYPKESANKQYCLIARKDKINSLSNIGNVSFNLTGDYVCLAKDITGDGSGPVNKTVNNFYDWSGVAINKVYSFASSVPVYDADDPKALESINAYIESAGADFSGATNADDVQAAIDNSNLDKVENSDDIPVPTLNAIETFDSSYNNNVSTKPNCVFKPRSGMSVLVSGMTGDNAIDNLVCDVQVGAYCCDSNGQSFTMSYRYFYTGDPVNNHSDGYIYDNKYLFNNVKTWLESADRVKLVNRLMVRVRFRVGTKASNWVVVTFANGQGGNTTAGVVDKDGNVVDNPFYDGGRLPGTENSGYSPGGFLGDNVNYFVSFIKSGFGLLDGGLIALMSKTFLFIPTSIWDIIKAYISSIVIITMIVLIIRAVVTIAQSVGSAISSGFGSIFGLGK